GGDATSYVHWQSYMSSDIEVCGILLPGRGARFNQTTICSWPVLIRSIFDAINEEDDVPFAFFGHSLGALISFEVARMFQKRGLRLPVHLFVSSCNPPSLIREGRLIRNLTDQALIDILRNYDGTPPEILENQELMQLLLPAIRADFTLVDHYKYVPRNPLNLSLTAVSGSNDKLINPLTITAWEDEISQSFTHKWLDGGHFYSKKEN
ncbi:thioesterase, partial [Pantoea allii]